MGAPCVETTPRSSGMPTRRPNLSRAARRDVRRAATLAKEIGFHSFRVHDDGTISWTLWRDLRQDKPKPTCEGNDVRRAETSRDLPSKRAQRSLARGGCVVCS